MLNYFKMVIFVTSFPRTVWFLHWVLVSVRTG